MRLGWGGVGCVFVHVGMCGRDGVGPWAKLYDRDGWQCRVASLLPSTPFVVQKEKDAKHKEVRGPVCGRVWELDHDRL